MLHVYTQSTVRSPRIMGHQLVDDEASVCGVGHALRDAKMQGADRVGIDRGCGGERASP
jgi:hypothetical protein